MASLNPLTRELVFKIVFYGPGLGGKTSTLQYIFEATKPEHRGKMVSLATPTDRTLYFDFLPLRMPRIRGMSVRLQLFTVPGQMYFAATRKLVLAGADGVVFVADSQHARADANRESLDDLRANLQEHGRDLREIPHTLLYNKRDLEDTMPTADMDRALNLYGAPSRGTVATNGAGIFAGLEEITRRVLRAYEADLPRSADGSAAAAPSSSSGGENGLEEAIRGLTDRIVHPTPPRGISAAPKMVSEPAPASNEAAHANEASEAEQPDPAPEAAIAHPLSVPPEAATTKIASVKAADMMRQPSVPPKQPSAPPVSMATNASNAGPHASLATSVAGFTLAPFWPAADRAVVHDVEMRLASRDAAGAILACERLVLRALASVAAPLGPDAPRDPAALVLLLGLDGARYLAFRTLVRRARRGERMDEVPAAYDALLFAAEASRVVGRVVANVQLSKR